MGKQKSHVSSSYNHLGRYSFVQQEGMYTLLGMSTRPAKSLPQHYREQSCQRWDIRTGRCTIGAPSARTNTVMQQRQGTLIVRSHLSNAIFSLHVAGSHKASLLPHCALLLGLRAAAHQTTAWQGAETDAAANNYGCTKEPLLWSQLGSVKTFLDELKKEKKKEREKATWKINPLY